MKRAIPLILDTLHTLALAIWLGGLVIFWTTVAPGGAQGQAVVADAVNRTLSGAWSSLETWIERCGIVMIAVQFLLRRRYQRSRPLYIADGVRQLLTFAALLLAEIARYRYSMPGALFEGKGSQLLLGFSVAQGVLLVAISALTAWLQIPRTGAVPGAMPPTVKAAAPAPHPPSSTSRKRRVKR